MCENFSAVLQELRSTRRPELDAAHSALGVSQREVMVSRPGPNVVRNLAPYPQVGQAGIALKKALQVFRNLRDRISVLSRHPRGGLIDMDLIFASS